METIESKTKEIKIKETQTEEIKQIQTKETQKSKSQKLKKLSLSAAKIIFIILRETGTITWNAFMRNSHARRFCFGHGPRHYHNYYRTVTRLKKDGFLSKHQNIYKLTSKGEREAFFSLLDFYKQGGILKTGEKPERWDGKWRIIFFDIPEKKRRYRDELRSMLKLVGFRQFQQSIWIYPHKVPNFLKDVLFEEGIKQFTRLITTDCIEYDKDLRRMFDI